MMSRRTPKLVLILAAAVALLAILGTQLNDPEVILPKSVRLTWRFLIMLGAGFSIGLMGLMVARSTKLKVHRTDVLSRPLFAWGLSYVMLALFVILQIASRIDEPSLSWRTPLAFVAFAIANIALWKLMTRFDCVIKKVERSDGEIKLSVIDLHGREGPHQDVTPDTPEDQQTLIPERSFHARGSS